MTPHVLLPEINTDYKTNFRIERDDIGVGTPLERFHHNRMAIQLLKNWRMSTDWQIPMSSVSLRITSAGAVCQIISKRTILIIRS